MAKKTKHEKRLEKLKKKADERASVEAQLKRFEDWWLLNGR